MDTHDTYTERLSEFVDGELSPAEHAEVDAHLRGCATCRETAADLRRVIARAARAEDTAPASELWPGVAARIGADTNVVPFRPARRFSFTLPQLVAAGLALMLLSGGMVWLARLGGPRTDFPPISAGTGPDQPTPVNFADAHYDEAIADLQEMLESGRSQLDAETVRVLEENLEAIDAAIEQCRRALAADPANMYLNQHLAQAKKRKLTLLRRATALTESAS